MTLRLVTRILSTGPGAAVHRTVMAPLDGPLMRLTRGRLHFGKGTIPMVVLRSTVPSQEFHATCRLAISPTVRTSS